MRLRIILLVVAISSLVLVSFLLPLALLLRAFAADQAKSTATIQAQWMVPLVATLDTPKLKLAVARVNAQDNGQPVTVFLPGGQTLGPPAARSAAVQLAAHGRSFTANVPGGVEVLVAVQGLPHGTAVIRAFVPGAKLTHGVLHAWIVLGGIGLGLLALSVIVSSQLARSLVRPLRALTSASEKLAAGDLSARAPVEGAPEVRRVSIGLNRLAVRIGELLAHERETVADLSHRLRTPLTALRIDAESLRDGEEMARVTNDVDGLTRTVNEIIREARRPTDGGGTTACDAAEIIRGRAAFWRALAEDQDRQMTVDVAAGILPVCVPARGVAACVDILLENVFAHTPEGSALAVRASSRAGGGAWLVVTDEGPGFRDPDPTLRGLSSGGSTGLGLDIARRIAETSGGSLMLGHSPRGGGAVTVGLGPAAAAAKPERRPVRSRLPTRARRAEDARLAAELSGWEAIAGRDLNMR
jgi:signal transduction histidine kinase